MHGSSRLLAAAATILGLAGTWGSVRPLHAGDVSARKPLALGDVAPPLEAKDLDGATWRLADARLVTAEKSLETVLAAVRVPGAPDPKPTDALDATPALRTGDAGDPAKVAALARTVGRPLGLVAGDATVAGWKTLADVATFVETGAKAPLVLVCWSSSCPTSRMYEKRLVEIATGAGARLLLVMSNGTDTEDAARTRVADAKLPVRVLLDMDQSLTDTLGGKRTPHVFVLDATGALRYAGGIDDDAAEAKPADARASWLRDAIVSLTDGRTPNVLLTTPKG